MTDTPQNPKRRSRRRVIILGVLLVSGLLSSLHLLRIHQRTEKLRREITAAGGELVLEPPLWQQLWARYRDRGVTDGTYVCFRGATIDQDWLRDHDDLRKLTIRYLGIEDSPLDGSMVSALIRQNPIKSLHARRVTHADQIAEALEHVQTIDLSGSDLTDAGLSHLRFEQLEWLDVSQTAVTPQGLAALQRCRQLRRLAIDGSQFTSEVTTTIRRLSQPLRSLTVWGVTEEHLPLLRTLSAEAQIEWVILYDCIASVEAIEELRADWPKSSYLVDMR